MTTPLRRRALAGGLALAGLLGLAAPAARAQAPLTFAPAAAYPTGGTAPLGVAVADVNGDGRPDVLTANQNTDDVSVLLGQASPAGALGPAARYDLGARARPGGLAVADLNGDGRPDVVVGNQLANTVAVLLNQPAAPGTFAPAVAYPAGGTGTSFPVVADLNGDGRPDVAVTNASSGTVAVLLASPTTPGTFQPATAYPAGTNALGLAVGDVNRDNRPDLAVVLGGQTAGRVAVLLAAAGAPGTFGAPATYLTGGATAVGVALADLTGDANPDLVVTNSSSGTVGVLPGTATGSFGPAATYAANAGPSLLTLADLTGDGRPDVVVADQTDRLVSVLAGQAAPAGALASPVSFATGGSSPSGLFGTAVGDLNRDGRPDVVAANYNDNTVIVLLNTTPLATAPARPAAAAVELYPNPASGAVTLRLPPAAASPAEVAAVRAELLDGLGRVVARPALRPAPGGQATVEVAGLPAGPYCLRLLAPTWQATRRLLLR